MLIKNQRGYTIDQQDDLVNIKVRRSLAEPDCVLLVQRDSPDDDLDMVAVDLKYVDELIAALQQIKEEAQA